MIGTSIAHYRITGKLGEGGMGEVYRATDTKLSRDVAIKVLPAAFASNPDRMARFEREAKVLAQLNHPGIAQVYGVEERALVMELVEGPTLAERIKEGPIPLEESMRIASQIAEALDYAHDKGIIHRDLKPANVKINVEGQVKILDFGLAKAVAEDTALAERSENSPTLTMGETRAGVILGTAGYMSPEQAKGKRADKRSDVWAFGVVLYEMLTAKRLFEGETVSDTLAQVLMKEPDLSAIPARARSILEACLDRDPKKRLRDIGDIKRVSAGSSAPSRARPGYAYWAVTAAATLATAALAFVHFRESEPAPQVLQYTIPAPSKARVTGLALSPDGKKLAIVANGERGRQLWVRALDTLESQLFTGTDEAQYPFWSPDSRWIAFFAAGKLKKVAATGGPAQTLCDAPNGRGGSWNREGVIVFAPDQGGGLSRVSAAGGEPVAVTKLADTGTHRFPVFLPDGRRFLYVINGAKQVGIFQASLDGSPNPKDHKRLAPDTANPLLVADESSFGGHILFAREETLMAQPVNLETLDSSGDIFPVAEHVPRGGVVDYSLASTSIGGMLTYLSGAESASWQLTWYDRSGKQLGTVGPRVPMRDFALSPDGKRVAVERIASSTQNRSDLWIYDLEHATEGRFTFDASTNRYPVWSPDGARVAFGSNRNGNNMQLYARSSSGTGQDQLLLQTKEAASPTAWSHDGKFIVFRRNVGKTGNDLGVAPLSGGNKPIPLVQSAFVDDFGEVSPDGRWLAYSSNESGRFEVYVQPFVPEDAAAGKPAAGRWQISTAGGGYSHWRADGKELFYASSNDRKMMAVEIRASGGKFDRGAPQALFELRFTPSQRGAVGSYAVSPDGKRFLISDEPGASGEAPAITVVTNWLATVKK